MVRIIKNLIIRKKTEGEKEKNLAKAMQELEITDEQLKEAKRIQYNTFRTIKLELVVKLKLQLD